MARKIIAVGLHIKVVSHDKDYQISKKEVLDLCRKAHRPEEFYYFVDKKAEVTFGEDIVARLFEFFADHRIERPIVKRSLHIVANGVLRRRDIFVSLRKEKFVFYEPFVFSQCAR